MEEIFERTGRVWRPGPGAIYPTLSWLEENGYVESTDEVRGREGTQTLQNNLEGAGGVEGVSNRKTRGPREPTMDANRLEGHVIRSCIGR